MKLRKVKMPPIEDIEFGKVWPCRHCQATGELKGPKGLSTCPRCVGKGWQELGVIDVSTDGRDR